MAISFETAAGPAECFLIGSLLVLVGVALSLFSMVLVRKLLGTCTDMYPPMEAPAHAV